MTAGNIKRTANDTGYAEKVERSERTTEVNTVTSSDIYELATTMNGTNTNGKNVIQSFLADDVHVGVDDPAKVGEVPKRFVRSGSRRLGWCSMWSRETCLGGFPTRFVCSLSLYPQVG